MEDRELSDYSVPSFGIRVEFVSYTDWIEALIGLFATSSASASQWMEPHSLGRSMFQVNGRRLSEHFWCQIGVSGGNLTTI
jgi:hypothetical protein